MRVLVAEDNPVIQVLLRNMLKHWGFDPVVVDNGADAWKVLAADDPPQGSQYLTG